MTGRAHRRFEPNGGWTHRSTLLTAALLAVAVAPVRAADGPAPDSVTVHWTAPGDDGSIGTAASYELRFSPDSITDANFDQATAVAGVPVPRAAGTRQSVRVRNLARGITYFFAIRTVDDAGNRSPLSNVFRFDWILDTAAPSPPGGVNAGMEGDDVRLEWEPSGAPDLLGYRVYRAFEEVGPFVELTTEPITETQFVDRTLPEGTAQVWYQISAVDATGNESAHSGSLTFELSGARSTWTLEDGYPNPSRSFEPVRIPVVVPSGATDAHLDVLDSGGRRVRRIELGTLGAGRREIVWDGKNDAGLVTAPGVYRGWLIAGGTRARIRLVRVP